MTVHTDLYRLVDELLSDSPDAALRAYRYMTEQELPWLEKHAVALARREKWTWGKIARYLGRSRQAVHTKFRLIRPAVHTGADAPGRKVELEFLKLYDPVTGRVKQPRSNLRDDEAIAW